MDVTPNIPEGRQIIETYGAGRFQISGDTHQGSVLVFPDHTLSWPVSRIEDVTVDSLRPVIDTAGAVELLLFGCGKRMTLLPRELRRSVREGGVVIDAMDTGAACRTFNVLMAEDRRVAAALIAVE